ncbi:MAG: glycosyltransferase family 2 protein [Candidatus Micrarchaeia archaeon]
MSSNEKPRISIIIPAHNEESVIGECVRRCLSQKIKPHEIIVVNDGSTDRTREIVEEIAKEHPEVKILNFERGHSAAFARNRGAEMATGDVLVFIDADIFVVGEDFLEKVAEAFRDERVAGAVLADAGRHKGTIEKCYLVKAKLTHFHESLLGVFGHYVPCMRRDIFFELGMFDEKTFYYEDEVFRERMQEYVKRKGMTIVQVRAAVEHADPSEIKEVLRQSAWVGKGLVSGIFLRRNLVKLLCPLNPPYWFLFAVSVFLYYFFDGIFLYVLFLFIATALFEFIIGWYLTGMLLASFVYVFIFSPMRSFWITYYFFTNLAKRITSSFSSSSIKSKYRNVKRGVKRMQ